jgi:hypothetical protein
MKKLLSASMILLAALALIAWSWSFSGNSTTGQQTSGGTLSGSASAECNCCGASQGGNLFVCDGDGQHLGYLVSHEANGQLTEVFVPEVNAIIKVGCSYQQENYVPDNEQVYFDDGDCGVSGGNAYVGTSLFTQNYNDINVLILNVDGDFPRFFRVSDPEPCGTAFPGILEDAPILSKLDNQGDCVAADSPNGVIAVTEVTAAMPFDWPPVCPWRYSTNSP